MQNNVLPPEAVHLTPDQQTAWHADVAALRGELRHHDLHPLRLGDLFNDMQQRWHEKMPALSRAAGVPYHTARRRARIAECIPPDSRIRDLGFPYVILRMLAPLKEQQWWAEQAWALQRRGKLRVDTFAALLEKAGVRQPRVPRVPRCLRCGAAAPDDPRRVHTRQGETTGWLCGPRCAAAYFHAQDDSSADTRPSPENETQVSMPQNETRDPSAANETRVSSEAGSARFPDRAAEAPAAEASPLWSAGAPPRSGGPVAALDFHQTSAAVHLSANETRVSIQEDQPPAAVAENEPRVSIEENQTQATIAENETRVSIGEIETQVSIEPPELPSRPGRDRGKAASIRPCAAGRQGRPPQPGRGPSRRDRRARAAQRRARGGSPGSNRRAPPPPAATDRYPNTARGK